VYVWGAVKINRAILLLTTMLIATHGAGILSTFHHLTHHAQATHIDACQNDQSTDKQAPKTPADQQQDTDCDLCLTLHTITPTLTNPAPLPALPTTRTLVSAYANQALPTPLPRSDRSTRAPPLS